MANPYLTKVFHFCAAHRYGHDDWPAEKNTAVFGPDARTHGHNYALEVTVTGPVDPDTGFCVDLGHLKRLVQEHVLAHLDHAQIEHLPWFRGKQPSSENMVRFIWEALEPHLNGPVLHRIRLRETPTIYTDYYGRDL